VGVSSPSLDDHEQIPFHRDAEGTLHRTPHRVADDICGEYLAAARAAHACVRAVDAAERRP
jgi:hypothetical protein